MTRNLVRSPSPRVVPLLAIAVLAACGSGGGDTGNGSGGGGGGSGGGGGGGGSNGSGGGSGDPGSGGGPSGPGGTGNPLSIVLDFSVANDATAERTETVCASIPFPEGGYPESQLANMVVSGHQTAWLPLQYWADGKVKVAQAQFTDTLQPGQVKSYQVARDEPALTGAFTRNAWVQQMWSGLELGAEVRDTFQVGYRSFATGTGTVVQSTPLVQVTRHRTYHTVMAGQTGIGRDYLTSTFYVTEFRDMPFVQVDWVLGNDYLGADAIPPGNTDKNLRALGTADVRGAWFLCKGATAIMPYRSSTEGIGTLETLTGSYPAHRVLTDSFLTDAQTRRYRFLLRMEPPGAASNELARWQATATSRLQNPLYPLATPNAWLQTKAAGLLGGPVLGPSDANARALGEFSSWTNTSGWFGTWGSRGDAMVTATTGTPRNHPLSPEFAHAVQGRCHRLVQKLEQMAWAQAMRPYHLWNLQVGADQAIILWDGTPMLAVQGESLGRRALRDADPWPQYRSLSVGQPRAHGWEHFDHEHWSCDLLFDYWTMSGDAWAKEELRQLGQSLKGLMRLNTYYTANIQPARAEGWCMQGFAQCYQATQDAALKQFAMRRVNEIIDPQRKKLHASKALTFQQNYVATGYPMNHEFFMPWQHGAVLYGFLGAYKAFGDSVLLDIAEDVPTTVEYSWVTNFNHPTFGFVANGLRYYVPASHNGTPVPANYWDGLSQSIKFGDSPLGGAHTFLIGGLHLLQELSPDATVRQKALLYGAQIRGTVADPDRWNKWYYCMPAFYAP
jgi:hypothetical protein